MKRLKTGMKDRYGKMIYGGDIITFWGPKLIVAWDYHPIKKIYMWLMINPGTSEVYQFDKQGKKKGIGVFLGGFSELSPNCYGQLPKIVGSIYKRR